MYQSRSVSPVRASFAIAIHPQQYLYCNLPAPLLLPSIPHSLLLSAVSNQASFRFQIIPFCMLACLGRVIQVTLYAPANAGFKPEDAKQPTSSLCFHRVSRMLALCTFMGLDVSNLLLGGPKAVLCMQRRRYCVSWLLVAVSLSKSH
jgi:hypothetical protein